MLTIALLSPLIQINTVQAQKNANDSISFKTTLELTPSGDTTYFDIPQKSNFIFGSGSPLCPTNDCKQEFTMAAYNAFNPQSPLVTGTLKIENKTTSTAQTIKYNLIRFQGDFHVTGIEEDRKTPVSHTLYVSNKYANTIFVIGPNAVSTTIPVIARDTPAALIIGNIAAHGQDVQVSEPFIDTNTKSITMNVNSSASREKCIYRWKLMSMSMSDSPSENQPKKAIRLTFTYEGDNMTLVSRQKVEKLLPLSSTSVNPQASSRFWFELSDSQGNTVHSQSLDNLIKRDMEVFSEDPNRSIIRQKIEDVKGTFSILIPDISNVTNFDIFTSPVTSDFALRAEQKQNVFHLNISEGQDNQ